MNRKRVTGRECGAMRFIVLAVAVGFLSGKSVMAQEEIKGSLVSVNWLEKNRKGADVLILDASPAKIYEAQHIPGAVSVDLYSYGIQDIPVDVMEQHFQAWGISPGKKIIVYDQGGSIMATRVIFDLYYHGFPAHDLFVLDGGLSMWQKSELPVTKEPTAPPLIGTFHITKFNEEARVRLPEILTASGDPENNALLEGLSANWHFGEVAPFERKGHIPNGILMPSADFYNPDKTFKSPEEIRKMLTYAGVRPDQKVYTYCGGGVAASVPFFAVKFILNYPEVKLYKESEMGWLQDERQLPYWTYDAPFLMRETKWLQWWGGQMLRMYGGAHVSIVDVRPAGEFNQGHLAFALNVPADVFKRNTANPGNLAEILASAGVKRSDEAVVISGAGVTRESALAFVLLEKLGQKKVSIFTDSLSKCAQLGYALTKDTSAGGIQKAPRGASASPVTTSGDSRTRVLITDPSSTRGLYPRVLIASGKNVPAKGPGGTVIHVPYTDLLNADGTPKPAKDVWNVLEKAGVPRYAELVCFSDDPGEAAVNYFVLKLMGYPDIKVLVL